MHRTVKSIDILEHSSEVGAEDVEFHEEDDIEYRDDKLVKSNGTIFISIDKTSGGSVRGQLDTDPLSGIATAQGSFSMQLKECNIVSHEERGRRAVPQSLDDSSSVEENLMAKYDEGKHKSGEFIIVCSYLSLFR